MFSLGNASSSSCSLSKKTRLWYQKQDCGIKNNTFISLDKGVRVEHSSCTNRHIMWCALIVAACCSVVQRGAVCCSVLHVCVRIVHISSLTYIGLILSVEVHAFLLPKVPHLCIHIYLSMYIHIQLHLYTHVYINMYIHTYIHICIYIYIYLYIKVYILHISIHTYRYIYIYIYIYIHIYIYIIYIYIHTYRSDAYVYIYIYTHSCNLISSLYAPACKSV